MLLPRDAHSRSATTGSCCRLHLCTVQELNTKLFVKSREFQFSCSAAGSPEWAFQRQVLSWLSLPPCRTRGCPNAPLRLWLHWASAEQNFPAQAMRQLLHKHFLPSLWTNQVTLSQNSISFCSETVQSKSFNTSKPQICTEFLIQCFIFQAANWVKFYTQVIYRKVFIGWDLSHQVLVICSQKWGQ